VLTVNKKLFRRLVESMEQMDKIVRGLRAPSREFHIDVAKAHTKFSVPVFVRQLGKTGENAGLQRPIKTISYKIRASEKAAK
jgi:hypothetical protein